MVAVPAVLAGVAGLAVVLLRTAYLVLLTDRIHAPVDRLVPPVGPVDGRRRAPRRAAGAVLRGSPRSPSPNFAACRRAVRPRRASVPCFRVVLLPRIVRAAADQCPAPGRGLGPAPGKTGRTGTRLIRERTLTDTERGLPDTGYGTGSFPLWTGGLPLWTGASRCGRGVPAGRALGEPGVARRDVRAGAPGDLRFPARRGSRRPAPGKRCESTLRGVLMFCVSEGERPERRARSRRTHPMRGWRNRQTRWIQVPVPERAWGFNSPLAHR